MAPEHVVTSNGVQESAIESSAVKTRAESEGNTPSIDTEERRTMPDGPNERELTSVKEGDHVQPLTQDPKLLFKSFLALPESGRDEIVELLRNFVVEPKIQGSVDRQDQSPSHEETPYEPSSQLHGNPRGDTYVRRLSGPAQPSYIHGRLLERSPPNIYQSDSENNTKFKVKGSQVRVTVSGTPIECPEDGEIEIELQKGIENGSKRLGQYPPEDALYPRQREFREPERKYVEASEIEYRMKSSPEIEHSSRPRNTIIDELPAAPSKEIFVNHFEKIEKPRAKSMPPRRLERSPDGETRFLESVISKETLAQNGYVFGIKKGEVLIDRALDHISIDNLIRQEERRLREIDRGEIENENGAIREGSETSLAGNDIPGISARKTVWNSRTGRPSYKLEDKEPLRQERISRITITESDTELSEDDRSVSSHSFHATGAAISRNPRRRAEMRETIRPIRRYPPRRRHYENEGVTQSYFFKTFDEVQPEIDAEGWRLGIKYEKRIHDELGQTFFEPAAQEDLAKNISRTTTELKDKGPGTQDFVVHIIREYQQSNEAPDNNRYRNPLRGPLSDYLGVTVEVRSTLLVALFKKIAPYYPDQSLKDEILSFAAPQRFLFHHLSHFRECVTSSDCDEATKLHVRILIKCLEEIDPDDNSVIKTIDGIRTKPPGDRTVPFVNIWTIYKPGTIVVWRPSSDFTRMRAYIVHSLSGHEKSFRNGGRTAYSTLWINCWSITYNEAGFFTRQVERLPIEPYQGAIDVESLDVVPLEYCVEREKMTKVFVERGRRYWALQGRNYMEYTNGPKNNLTESITVRVMIDLAAYKKHEQRANANGTVIDSKGMRIQVGRRGQDDSNSMFGDVSERGGYPHVNLEERRMDEIDNEDPPELQHRSRKLQSATDTPSTSNSKPVTFYSQCGYMHEEETPTDEQVMLCASHVWGYSFREKNWARYAVDKLYKVEFKKKSFDKLVMNNYYKDIVRAMVANHIQEDTNQFRDLVDGKGQGVVILLHGPPGVGKTLTAECIADLYERPLIAVTCGDIGTDPDVLEAKLEDVFRRAEEWGAVLLLDEADVFLAERNLESLERNALVSIFLRTLEYFNGILFLTTNRIGTIDEAFQSRLHVTLGLSALSVDDRKQVWHNFLAGLKHLPRDARKDLIKKSRSEWAQQPLNGRQIRNCVRTALVLARQEQVPVNQTHFERVIQLGNDYVKYLTKLKKMDMDHLAEAMGTRLKAFSKEGRTVLGRMPVERRGERMMEVGRMEQVVGEDESLSESEKEFHM